VESVLCLIGEAIVLNQDRATGVSTDGITRLGQKFEEGSRNDINLCLPDMMFIDR
jgi:hypothetical protein